MLLQREGRRISAAFSFVMPFFSDLSLRINTFSYPFSGFPLDFIERVSQDFLPKGSQPV